MPRPALTATVPRRLVHRAAVAETILSDWEHTGPDRFTLFAQRPRAHRLHVSPDRSPYEPLRVAETVRRRGALLAHAEYDAPFDHCLVLKKLQLTTVPEYLAVAAVPVEPLLHGTVSDVRHRAGRPTALRHDTDVRLVGERVATAHIAVSWTGESVHRRLRGGRTAATVTALPFPPALPAAAVDRALPVDVVPAPPDRPGRRQLRVDTAHPVFFDHPPDHISGMLLLEAARQAARVRAAGPAGGGSFRAACPQYAELDRPTWIEVPDATGTGLETRGFQGESSVFECAVGAAAR
ncbi:ScbA/BarX family gamma-butyrolactone biosynthesis protein [Streptomyces sp. NRRL S-646]|uniref:ScbA/BarX family gamma-butyrolactone biosynthesis protein n=1 Tax=Streptomyces sp. NRRL S-646 TaxID=1463917 RepID=UPI0004C91687|nr:ScbA/BarX family gamma-butyrolactone biosynthesis protein [Streptomyces sp. NRRL S-646]